MAAQDAADKVEQAPVSEPPLQPVLSGLLGWEQSPHGTQKTVAQSSDLQDRGKFTSLLNLLMVGSPVRAFLRCSLPGTSAG